MYFNSKVGPAPTIGVEVEVARWRADTTMTDAAQALYDDGFMLDGSNYRNERCDWHCKCPDCSQSMRINMPPLWVMQRDGSLPDRGAEFISSPFPATEPFIEKAVMGFEHISQNALMPTKKTMDQRGRFLCEVGIHVHAHILGPELEGLTRQEVTDGVKALNKFTPEVFALAAANTDRSLRFRMPIDGTNPNLDRNNSHHTWLSPVLTAVPARLEWRLWETNYKDLDRFREAIVLSAAMTQLLATDEGIRALTGWGYLIPDWSEDYTAIEWQQEKGSDVVAFLDLERLSLLEQAIVTSTAVATDPYSLRIVEGAFERVTNNAR